MLSFEEYDRKFEDFKLDDYRTKLVNRSIKTRIIYSMARIEGKITIDQMIQLYSDEEAGCKSIAVFVNLKILKQIDETNFEYIPYTPIEDKDEN